VVKGCGMNYSLWLVLACAVPLLCFGDDTPELKKAFTDLLPIPNQEMERFYEKYPGAKP